MIFQVPSKEWGPQEKENATYDVRQIGWKKVEKNGGGSANLQTYLDVLNAMGSGMEKPTRIMYKQTCLEFSYALS